MKGKIAGIVLLSLSVTVTTACGREPVEEKSASGEEDVEITLTEDSELTEDYTSVEGVYAENGIYQAIVSINLDSGNSRAVMDLLMKASRYYQQTILMITHNEHLTAGVDRVLLVRDGRLADMGGVRA